jgi:hypothetical protein
MKAVTHYFINTAYHDKPFLLGWGNARDANVLWDNVLTFRANRVFDNPESVKTIEPADVQKAFSKMQTTKIPKLSEQNQASREADRQTDAPGGSYRTWRS